MHANSEQARHGKGTAQHRLSTAQTARQSTAQHGTERHVHSTNAQHSRHDTEEHGIARHIAARHGTARHGTNTHGHGHRHGTARGRHGHIRSCSAHHAQTPNFSVKTTTYTDARVQRYRDERFLRTTRTNVGTISTRLAADIKRHATSHTQRKLANHKQEPRSTNVSETVYLDENSCVHLHSKHSTTTPPAKTTTRIRKHEKSTTRVRYIGRHQNGRSDRFGFQIGP